MPRPLACVRLRASEPLRPHKPSAAREAMARQLHDREVMTRIPAPVLGETRAPTRWPRALEAVSEVMNRDPITIAGSTPAAEAFLLARRRDVHYLLVTEDETLVGVICTCDLLGTTSNALTSSRMKAPWPTITSGATQMEAALLMRENRIGCLPVVQDDELCGVVTRFDLRDSSFDRSADLDGWYCDCCGESAHVVPHPRMDSLSLCSDCLERARRPFEGEDVGIVD